jgi:hypothetical protein
MADVNPNLLDPIWQRRPRRDASHIIGQFGAILKYNKVLPN